MTDLKKQTGQRLREFRNAKSYSIEELAHIADMNAVHLASLERGEKNITLSTLEKVVTALGISLTDVFSFEIEVAQPECPTVDKASTLMKQMTIEEQDFILKTIQFISRNKQR